MFLPNAHDRASASDSDVAPDADVALISDVETAAVLLRDPRRRILEMARTPVSAVEIAEELSETRQRIGYHVRRLVGVGLLHDVEVSRRGAMIEKRYRASAGAYALAPGVLGPLAARLDSRSDRESLAHLLGAVHQVQRDLVDVLATRERESGPVPTLTLSTQLRFRDQGQRGAFAEALIRALTDVVATYASEFTDTAGAPAHGEPFRLTLTLNPTQP
jgi:DNA-binding transcriptional ArsR family regulator